MKKIIVGVLLGFLFVSTAYAQDPGPVASDLIDKITAAENATPAIVNEPISFWNTALDIIGRSDFGIETSYDMLNDDWFGSASISLFDFDSEDHVALGSIRAGVGIRKQVYGSLSLNLPSIFGAHVPDSVKGNAGLSANSWAVIGNLANVHIGLGYQAEYEGQEGRVIAPIGIGGTIRF